MMELIKTLTLMENQKKADREIGVAIDTINKIYREWKKRQRRRNAVNIVTTSVNAISHIDPSIVDHIHDAGQTKLAVIIMRCMDLPPWMDVETKRITYRRLFPLINKLQRQSPNTGTGGNLSDAITTHLSAAICHSSEDEKERNVFVAYEPTVSRKYVRYIFGEEMPNNVARMQTLSLPEDYDTLLNIIRINHKKACEKYNGKPEDINNG